MERLTSGEIDAALARLDASLGRRGVRVQLYLVGGAVMCLVHHARTSTKHVQGRMILLEERFG